ncbi:MAG: hypothetical protein MK213_01730 [Planctomycetes bacterium]|nr:hypothetical protein [Planctomycetota bacterium]
MPEPSLPASLLPFATLLSGEAGETLQLDKPLWLTKAPARLPVLGGPAHAPGTASLSVPLSRSVATAIQDRDDRKIRIRWLQPEAWGGERCWEGEIDDLYTKKGPPRSMAVLKAYFESKDAMWMMRFLAVMLGLRRTRQLNTPKKGFEIVVWSRIPMGENFGERAAFGVSLAMALKGSTGLSKKRVDGVLVARAVMQGYDEILGEDVPLIDALTSALGRNDCMLYIEHGANLTMQWVPIPAQCSFAAADLCYEDYIPREDRDHSALVSRMALFHLNKALKAAGEQELGSWGQVAPSDFEDGLRDHVPASQKGADWLKEFRRNADAKEILDRIEPTQTFRLRAAAEHECRESARARSLVQNLNDYSRSTREAYLAEAGRCLLSSHRSLSEKCKLEHPVANDFITVIKDAGRKEGMFGARVTREGGSSVMSALVHQSARQDFREMVETFTDKHKECDGSSVIIGTEDGGVLRGWWEGVLEPKEEIPEGESGTPTDKKKAATKASS